MLEEKKAKQKLVAKDEGSSEGSGSDKPKKRNDDASSEDSECDEEYDNYDANANFAPIDVSKQKELSQTKRTSVSAEVFGKYHVKGIFKAEVIKKS